MKRSRVSDSNSTGTNLRILAVIGIFMLILEACQHPSKDKITSGVSFGKIIYDTYIINRDSTDVWEGERLATFNRNAMIQVAFDEVFAGRITPTDYFTGETIPLAQLRKMESEGEFSRKNISKIQFEEQWIWDKEKSEMVKRINSMTIAYEVFDNTGKSRGQKPIFKLIFRKE